MPQRLRLLALALLIAAGLFAVLEVALRTAGVGGARPAPRLNSRAGYFVPIPGQPGFFQSQFGPKSYRTVPPKGDATRIMIFGGSNAGSFGRRDLTAALDGLVGADKYEVRNVGSTGYGSDRTRIIVAQSVELFEPDIAVIYTGDIEFLEYRFARSGAPDEGSGWLRSLPRWLRQTHICGVLARLASRPAYASGRVPEPLRIDTAEHGELTYDRTLARFEDLRANLRAMCGAAFASGARVVLCTPVYNRWGAPFSSNHDPGTDPATIARCAALLGEARALIPTFAKPLLVHRPDSRVFGRDWMRGKRPSGQRGPLPGRRPCLGPLAGLDPGFRPRSGWTPRIRSWYEGLDRVHARRFGNRERAGMERAEAVLRRLLAIVPDHPAALFDLAVVSYLLERDQATIVDLFERAAECDRIPRKGSRLTNRIIREVAAEYPEVLLFDADGIFASYFPMGLTGYEFMSDHAHLAAGGRRVVMRDLAKAIVARWP